MTQPDPYQLVLSSVQSRGSADDWFQLGALLYGQSRWGAAAGCFARAAQLRPEDHRAWCNWGWALHRSGRHAEGAEYLRRAIALRPDEGTSLALLAQVLPTIEDEQVAVGYGFMGVELEHGPAINHVGYAIALMAAGQWREGWAEYEHRFAYKMPELLTRPYPLWRGERVERLFIEAEQGLGDTIFALRWVYEAARRVPEVVLYVQRELWALVRECGGLPANVSVYPLPRALPAADAFCPMLSLPVALGDGEPDGGEAYLVGDARNEPLDIASLRFREAPFTSAEMSAVVSSIHRLTASPRRIGLCWAGNPNHELAHWRDVPLAYLLPLTEIAGTEWHSLQVGPRAADLSELGAYGLIQDRSPEIMNFLDTARVVAGLDLIVTVDTGVAHLAGAMGVPCWMLLNDRGTDFRWMRRSTQTGWYGSMRLWRRSLDEDWAALVERVGDGLRELVG